MRRSRSSQAATEAAVNELTAAVGQLLRRLRSETKADDLNLSQLSALARLDQQGAMNTADMARLESMKPQSMGAILAVLEQEGLVERKAHPTDGRQFLFDLTSEGKEVRRQHGAAKRAWLLTAMEKLDAAELQALLDAIPLIKRLGET
jgi:DNA-binding MarR family transcriptional regulator